MTSKDFCNGFGRDRQAELLTKQMQYYLDSVCLATTAINEMMPIVLRTPNSGLKAEIQLG